MKTRIIFLFAFIAIVISANAQPSFIKDSLDNYISTGIKDWQIPGLAIAIIKDGKIVVMKGYGVRNLQTKEPVDENTLFMIASNSKLFTGTSLAMLEHDGKLSLNDKITKYFPNYTLYDPNTTNLVTIKDMLGHHLGTKTFQGDFTFWNSSLSRGEIMGKMKLLKPAAPFRQSFGYCNSCFLTAGEVIPIASGKPWEVFVYDSIMQPLGMTNTHPLGYNMEQMEGAATPYTNTFSKDLVQLPYDNVDNLAPAGSIVSCVKDMSKWITMQLDSGMYNGKQIIPWSVINKTRQMQTIIASGYMNGGRTHYIGYGLGVFQEDYDGKQLFWHTGGADGFVTNTCFIPEENLGICILTNNDNQGFFELLRMQIIDAYLGLPYVNKSKAALAGALQEHQEMLDAIAAYKKQVKDAKTPEDITGFLGSYSNELFGPITIQKGKNNSLHVVFEHHANLTAEMEYMGNNQWLLSYSNPAFGIFPATFSMDGGKVSGITIKVNDFLEYDPYFFKKE